MLLNGASAPSIPDQVAVLSGSRLCISQGVAGMEKRSLSTCGGAESFHGRKTRKRGAVGGSCERSEDSE